jgi:hypothetical protein
VVTAFERPGHPLQRYGVELLSRQAIVRRKALSTTPSTS